MAKLVCAFHQPDGSWLSQVVDCKRVALLETISNYEFYAFKDPEFKHTSWVVFEKSCGSIIGRGRTRKDAIQASVTALKENNACTDKNIEPFIRSFRESRLREDNKFYDLEPQNITAMARKTKDNLYKTGVDTLSAHMTLGRKSSLEENLQHLRDVLSVDIIIDDINQEEALEFLDAITEGVALEKEAGDDVVSEMTREHEEALKEKDGEIEELKADVERLETENAFTESIKTASLIEYRTSNLMDEAVMDALREAYESLTPVKIIERLKIRRLKAV